jgi:DNA processing protein
VSVSVPIIEHMFVPEGGLTVTDMRNAAVILALADAASTLKIEWYKAAVIADEVSGSDRILGKEWSGLETFDPALAEQLVSAVTPAMIDRAARLIDEAEAKGDRVVTVLDDDYPVNLRQIYNRPPFLFVRGKLQPDDEQAIAVVGTRKSTPDGEDEARRLAAGLADEGITVLSGLAIGIDSAAHTAALDAGGRTVAVMGTGINQLYPAANRPLAERILQSGGALVSQFWPDAPPTKWSFPMRNLVMSGMAMGTVVIEASDTSGARNQARQALDHQKRVFMVRRLVEQEEWAQLYARRGAQFIDSVDDVRTQLVSMVRPPEQLVLG